MLKGIRLQVLRGGTPKLLLYEEQTLRDFSVCLLRAVVLRKFLHSVARGTDATKEHIVHLPIN